MYLCLADPKTEYSQVAEFSNVNGVDTMVQLQSTICCFLGCHTLVREVIHAVTVMVPAQCGLEQDSA